MLFDLSIRGHHPNYLRHLIKYWYDHKLSGSLSIVVSPKFLLEHGEVVALAVSCSQSQVKFVSITTEEETALNSRKSFLKRAVRNFQEWKLLRKYTALLKATHCLIMYFDTYELLLALGAQSPCPFSGIYFRPTFHYGEFSNYQFSWREALQKWREKLLLSRLANNLQLKTLFCLDPFVSKYLGSKFLSRVNAVTLPDPVETFDRYEFQSHDCRQKLGIEPNRRVFLLFGSLTSRKGIWQLLEAIETLSPSLCQNMCLLLVGESNVETQLTSKIKAICQAKSIQIISRYEFIPEPEVPTYFQLADVILAPYQRHVGMSGILLLAAAAQKPVLSSDYGLMGELVRSYKLGITVDSTKPEQIARGMSQFLLEDLEKLSNRALMKNFAEQNSPEKFAQIIFQYCLN